VFGAAKWGIVIVALVLCLHNIDKQFELLTPELREKSVVYTTLTPYAERAWQEIRAQVEAERTAQEQSNHQ
jgi:hypothetical protein